MKLFLNRIFTLCCRMLFLGGGALCLGIAALCVKYRGFMRLTTNEIMEIRPNGLWVLPAALALLDLLSAQRERLARVPGKWIYAAGCALWLAIGSALIWNCHSFLRADAGIVFEAARVMNEGNFDSLTEPGGYFFHYPHNLGIATFFRLLLFFTGGAGDFRIYFYIYLLLNLLSVFFLWKLSELLSEDRAAQNLTLILSFLFLPFLLYLFHLYNGVPGFCALLGGLVCFIRWAREGRRGFLVGAVLLPALACLLRSNFWIPVIALGMTAFFRWFETRERRILMALAPLVIVSLLLPKGLELAYRLGTGQRVNDGVPMISYVTMGLQEGDKSPGWYNSYVKDVYNHCYFDGELTEKTARKALQDRLEKFSKDPRYAYRFFRSKVLTTWCDPTFQSVWTGPMDKVMFAKRPDWFQSLYGNERYGGTLYNLLRGYGNVLTVFIFGCAGFCVFASFRRRCPLSPLWLFPLLSLIGTFTFHFVWETKSQYVWYFVILLIPPAAKFAAEWRSGR